jgi:hypothetical protein
VIEQAYPLASRESTTTLYADKKYLESQICLPIEFHKEFSTFAFFPFLPLLEHLLPGFL